jgi:hypothetical protein
MDEWLWGGVLMRLCTALLLYDPSPALFMHIQPLTSTYIFSIAFPCLPPLSSSKPPPPSVTRACSTQQRGRPPTTPRRELCLLC